MKLRKPSAAEERAEGEMGGKGGCTCGKGCGMGSGCRGGKGGGKRATMAQAALKRVKMNVRKLAK
jgi:hypothetical protein